MWDLPGGSWSWRSPLRCETCLEEAGLGVTAWCCFLFCWEARSPGHLLSHTGEHPRTIPIVMDIMATPWIKVDPSTCKLPLGYLPMREPANHHGCSFLGTHEPPSGWKWTLTGFQMCLGKTPSIDPAPNFYPSDPPPRPVQKDQVSAPKEEKFLNNGMSRCAGTREAVAKWPQVQDYPGQESESQSKKNKFSK